MATFVRAHFVYLLVLRVFGIVTAFWSVSSEFDLSIRCHCTKKKVSQAEKRRSGE